MLAGGTGGWPPSRKVWRAATTDPRLWREYPPHPVGSLICVLTTRPLQNISDRGEDAFRSKYEHQSPPLCVHPHIFDPFGTMAMESHVIIAGVIW